mgnify:CR=1 FL=1
MERSELGRNLIFRQFLWGSPAGLETGLAVSKEVHFCLYMYMSKPKTGPILEISSRGRNSRNLTA